MRLICGARNVDIITNGVDTEYFEPNESAREIRYSAIFWGRLDFEPNIQAMEWFCKNVWPALFNRHPDARLTIIGACPSEKVLKLGKQHGIQILVDVDDLRPQVAAHQVVVFPFVSGGGIKNKLLEAAAMGKAIVSSPAGVGGLRGCHPFHTPSNTLEWCKTIEDLWAQPLQRKEIGRAARNWVCVQHTWDRAAKAALDTIKASQIQRRHSN
jgi:glycosyltransferase involved in cell wall biosynthesis